MAEPARAPDRDAGEPRWQAFLRHARDPVFLFNRQRRLLFANAAFEECSGFRLAALRGRPCRAVRGRSPDAEEALLATLTPPPDALAGQPCRARRRTPGTADGWWQLDFFPLHDNRGLLGILGRITILRAMPSILTPLPERLMALRDRQAMAYRLDALSDETPAMRRLVEQARVASQGRMAVTLIGAPGTGKHWLARAIHQAGPQRERCFAALDCGALPATYVAEVLLEPRGRQLPLATVYLREPAELPRELQERLADLLSADEPPADRPRLMVGHRDDPTAAVRAGRLMEVLHCATSTLTIHVPTLRERFADLDPLVNGFLARSRLLTEHNVAAVSADALAILRGHAWHGNVRELFEVLSEAAARAKAECIEPADLPFYLRTTPAAPARTLPLDEFLGQAERRLIIQALTQAKGNRSKAAKILGISRPRLHHRMAHLHIEAAAIPEDEEAS